MGNIKLATYDTVLPNEVFGRKVDPQIFGDEKTEATQLIRLTKFKVPLWGDVLNFIRKSAINFSDIQRILGASEIATLLGLLPEGEIEKIAKGYEFSLNHLRNHYPEYLEEGGKYLEVLSGIVPTRALGAAREISTYERSLKGPLEGESAYRALIKTAGLDEWALRIRLSDGQLPSISEREYLLERKVRDSDVIQVIGDSRNYSSAANHARLLYNASDSGLANYLKDSSDHFMLRQVCSTLKGVVACLSAKDAVMDGLFSRHKGSYEGASSN